MGTRLVLIWANVGVPRELQLDEQPFQSVVNICEISRQADAATLEQSAFVSSAQAIHGVDEHKTQQALHAAALRHSTVHCRQQAEVCTILLGTAC